MRIRWLPILWMFCGSDLPTGSRRHALRRYFYWVALADFTGAAHGRALALTAARARSHIVTADEVSTEYLTFFAAAPEPVRCEATESVEGIPASSAIRVIPQSRESLLARLQLYRARPGKGYSLVDCISLQTMRREGLTEALTSDRHSEQEGFRAIFRGRPRRTRRRAKWNPWK